MSPRPLTRSSRTEHGQQYDLATPKMDFSAIGILSKHQQNPSLSPASTNNYAANPAKKRRIDSTDYSHLASPSHKMSQAMVTPPTTPPKTPPQAWQDIDLEAHMDRSRIFTQTRILARCKTLRIYITSSRGFERELPPTKQTRPALRQRRHSIDVVTQGWNPGFVNYSSDCWTVDKRGSAVPWAPAWFDPVPLDYHETDEPIRREPTLFPNPRRYLDLERAEHHHFPPYDMQTYLELPKSSLSNEDFRTITVLSFPDCWFRDNILDVALEMTALKYSAEANGIAIANSLMGQVLFFPGEEGDTDGNNYASMNEYKKMYENKKWIIIPINDGFVEKDPSQAQGCHWSLIAVNRAQKRAHYVDSLFKHDPRYQELAYTIAKGLGNILGEEYTFSIEYNAPHQWQDNGYDNSIGIDLGPCGPFVVMMVQIYVNHIISMRSEGRENQISFNLSRNFKERFSTEFDSRRLRIKIARNMASLKVKLESDRITTVHDMMALAGLEDSVEFLGNSRTLSDDDEAEDELYEAEGEQEAKPLQSVARKDDFEPIEDGISHRRHSHDPKQFLPRPKANSIIDFGKEIMVVGDNEVPVDEITLSTLDNSPGSLNATVIPNRTEEAWLNN